MKPNYQLRFAITMVILANLLLIFSLVVNDDKPKITISPEGVNSIYDSCINKTMFESAKCVNTIVKQIFQYNISNIGKELSFLELLEQGTVCEGWASLYCLVGDELGYNTKLVQFPTNYITLPQTKEYEISHIFCIWSNARGYIILDQTQMFSFEFAEVNKTKLEEAINGR